MMLFPHRFDKSLFALLLLAAALPAQEGKAGLALAVNGVTDTAVFRGWPMLVEVTAILESGEPVQAQWPSPIVLTIRAGNAAVTWPLQFSSPTEGTVTVSNEHPASAVWTLSGEATAALSAGDYTIRAEHSATGASQIVVLKVADEPAELTRELGSLKARLRSRYEEWAGTREKALEILNSWLVTTPDDIAVLGQKSDLLNDMEKFPEALESAELALQAFREQVKQPTHPPILLMRRIRALEAVLLKP